LKKISFFILTVLLCSTIYSQNIITKYFDSDWHEVSKDSAFYYSNFEKKDTAYKVTSYWAKSNKLNTTSIYADTNFYKGIGLLMRYYESGKLQDSMHFTNSGGMETDYHFKENGQLDYKVFYDAKKGGLIGEQYDSLGKKVTGYFSYQIEAKFPGGNAGWNEYLESNIKSNVAAKHKAPVGIYTVTVSFLIDKNGKVIEVKALTDPGYGTAEEAVRVIRKSPDWMPAIQNNKPVIYRQKQNISFQVTEK
jgi:antitoxin component YwqK of YwqJK toxin-antitoxin module